MAGLHMRIFGKGHTLCLTRTLQAAYEYESFTDIRLAGFVQGLHDNDSDVHFARANRAVLAAASPFLAHILEASTEEEETTVIIAGCSRKDISNLIQYIYTGKASVNSKHEEENFLNLLKYLRVGETRKKENIIAPLKDAATSVKPQVISNLHLVNQAKASSISTKQSNPAVQCTAKKIIPSIRKVPVYPLHPLTLHREDVTMHDPVLGYQEHLMNLDVLRTGCLLEKSVVKHGVLGRPDSSLNDRVFDYPRLADRLGIYFDPHLSNYYRSLIRSSPPIRIFLEIGDEWAESDEAEDMVIVKKPTFIYHKGISKNALKRKTLSGNRLQVNSIYFFNGKKHVVLDDGVLFKDDFIPRINYPASDEEYASNDNSISDNEDVNTEVRRRRALLNTLSELRNDHKKAKKAAQDILKVRHCSTGQQEIREDSCTSSKKPSQRPVVCEICGKLISASWIRVHFANHLGEKNYLCEHCGRSFASANLLKSHVHYQHNSQITTYKCAICNKAFIKKSRLDIHMRIHSDTRPYLCPVPECGKRFHTNGNLRKHSFVHSGEKPHKCNFCDKAFSQPTNLRHHLRLHGHTTEGKSLDGHARMRKQEAVYNCEFCPITFSRKRHFLMHRASHTGEQTTVPCSSCDKEFPDIQELKRHKLTDHPGSVHQCPICDKTFFKKTAMLRHQAIHTQGLSANRVVFKCQHCNSQFSSAAARTVHERLHTGERPFSCQVCSKAFTSKYNFRQHLRMHSEDRPFKCNQCDKSFRQPQHLRAHTYIHKSEENPIPCPDCGKQFKNRMLMISHKRIHRLHKSGISPPTTDSVQPVEFAISHQAHEEPDPNLHLVDPNVGFVNILVLTDNSELQ